MDAGFIKFLLPQIPSLAQTALWHSFGKTPTADKWDLRTELTVHVLRHLMGGNGRKPTTISQSQATTLKDPGIKGKLWIAKATVKAPQEEDETLREAVFKAVDDMAAQHGNRVQYTKPHLADIEVEWTGFRPNAGKEERLPDISEEMKFRRLLEEPSRTSETTVLYFHGGAYYLCDPSTHRTVCSRLAKESHGRVCSVRYRLAPQHAFPSQLLDAFMMYLSLLYPPAGSMHQAVLAKHIVLGGDSAGGNLTFALLQLLLQLHRTSEKPTVRFHGVMVDVPLPAGVTACSGWFDVSRAMPSITHNAKFDYLPPADHDDPWSRFPPDHVWPADPPRGDLFCDLSLLDHPLVSPMAAESWQGAPPLWLSTGQELLTDEDCIVVSHAAAQGVIVQFEQYEAMPHCFAMLIPHLPTSNRSLRSWGNFCRQCVEEPQKVETNGVLVYAKSGREEPLSVLKASTVSWEEARNSMLKVKQRRLEGYEKGGKAIPKPAL